MTDALRAEIEAERARQDAQWGGPAHDDGHHVGDWIAYIRKQARRALLDGRFRERLIKIAALAVAAIESLDRKGKK